MIVSADDPHPHRQHVGASWSIPDPLWPTVGVPGNKGVIAGIHIARGSYLRRFHFVVRNRVPTPSAVKPMVPGSGVGAGGGGGRTVISDEMA